MNEKLLQKKGRIVSQIATDLLGKEVNDRFMPINYYQEKFGASQGTIQNAINFLKDKGAITLKNKGYQGSFIKAIDHDILMEYCEQKSIRGCMPLPRNERLEVLAYYLHQRLQGKGISFQIDYLQSEALELEALITNKSDFMVCSRYMAETYIRDYQDIEIVMEFHKESLIDNPILVSNSHAPIKSLYVASDSAILRMLGIHYAEVQGLDVKLLPEKELLKLLKSKEHIACILPQENVYDDKNFYILPLNHEEYKSDMIGVILMKKDRVDIAEILVNHLQPDELHRVHVQFEEGSLELQY